MTSNNESKNTASAIPATWTTRVSFIFGLCALLGILLLIFSEIGFAQGGFRPGGPSIGNPINDDSFEDEDFEDFDEEYDEPIIPPTGRTNIGRPNPSTVEPKPGKFEPSSGISVGGSAATAPTTVLKRNNKGFELSGPGTDKSLISKNQAPSLPVDTESGEGIPASKEVITDFNFPDADIMDIAKTLGKLTGKNFILDKEVKGRVSIISNSPITVSDAWRAFLTSLDMNGLAIVPTGKYLRIMRQNDAKGKNVRLYSGTRAPNTDALVTKIFKIKYISAKELENVIRTYANMGARIYGFEQTNTLIITDTGSNIEKIAKMIAFLDVEGFDAGIEVIPVKYASAMELQKLIDSLLPGTQASFNTGRPGFGGAGGGARGGAGAFTARRTKQGGFVNTIIPDERTNTLIVHANPKGAEEVRDLVARLDRKLPPSAGGGKVHVVYLQFAEAEDMAKTLSNFSQNARPSGGSFPGGPIGGLGMNPTADALFEGQIKVSADKTTNSLVITASPSDYVTLQRVINKLDIPRDQIYVEVVIMEMNMQRSNEYTANILGPGGTSVSPTNDLVKTIIDPTSMATQKGLVLRWVDQKNLTTITPPTGNPIQIPNLGALLKALQTYSGANILATPQLMTMDNSEAVFESTDKVPVPKINNAGLGIQTTSFDYMSVPLSIKIKPQLNKISNFIKMDIKAKISDFSSRSLEAAPATLERNAETSVMVSDTDTIVLGGLTRDKSTEVMNKVPLLGDIPILGWLFKSKNSTIEKTNLMIFITPKIMRQPENVRMVLDKKLKERDEFVERAFGGEDYHRDARNKIIRGLPDVKKITNYNTKRILNLDDDDMVKENAKEAAARSGEPITDSVDGQDTLTLPAADLIPSANPPVAAPQSLPANPDNKNPVPSGSDPFAPITAPSGGNP
jgi:general secretion pathway protein D